MSRPALAPAAPWQRGNPDARDGRTDSVSRAPDQRAGGGAAFTMRVIAGRYRGRRLASPSWSGLRPTSDRLKETMFNVLGNGAAGARVLDGFAGSGALGIEALSRGARAVTFIDTDLRALGLVEANLAHCEIAEGYVMIRSSFVEAVRRLPADQLFELILLDPPYEQTDLDDVLKAATACLAPRGILVLEHARRRPVPAEFGVLTRFRVVTAGDSALALYRLGGVVACTAGEEA
jgi:16S rRNA (guanine966-N2)-methyltransferase